jgi:hypothetical protein
MQSPATRSAGRPRRTAGGGGPAGDLAMGSGIEGGPATLRAGGRIEAGIEGQLMGTGGLHSSSTAYI